MWGEELWALIQRAVDQRDRRQSVSVDKLNALSRRCRFEHLEFRDLLAVTVPYAQDFESGDLALLDGWQFVANSGTIALTTAQNPHGGTQHLLFDTANTPGSHDATLLLDLSNQVGATDLTLDFWMRSYTPSTYAGDLYVQVSGNGSTWISLVNIYASQINDYTHRVYDLDQALNNSGITFDQDVYVRFRHYGSSSSFDLVLDDVRVTNLPIFGSLSLAPQMGTIHENDAPSSTTVTLSRTGDAAPPLMVSLSALNSDQVQFPATVTIPAGTSSVDFQVTAANDGDIDGLQTVEFTATALGATPGSTVIQVADDDTSARRTLGGSLTGIISPETYYVTSSINVVSGRTLAMESGAQLLFESQTGLTVTGILNIQGTEQAPVILTSAAANSVPGDWSGLTIDGGGPSILDYVEIAYATIGLRIDEDSIVTLGHADIHHGSGSGIYASGTSTNEVVVYSSRIHDNVGDGIHLSAYASGCTGEFTGATISGNLIVDNQGDGIDLDAAGSSIFYCIPRRSGSVGGVISGNVIRGNAYGINGTASASSPGNGASVSTSIENNLIDHNDSIGVRLIASTSAGLSAKVVNNTIADNPGAALSYNKPITVENNIVSDNGTGFAYTGTADPGTNVRNNLLWNNTAANWSGYPSAFGAISALNANGELADQFLNVSADPQLVAIDDYHLQLSSPAINAGASTTVVPESDSEGDARVGLPDIGFDEAIIPGDYDRNGVVAETDFDFWRSSFGATAGAALAADGNGNDTVDAADYTVWRDNFGRAFASPLPPRLLGDYNGDNNVDGADYTVWRDTLGLTGVIPYSGADGSGDGMVDETDFNVWRSHFGTVLSVSSVAGAGSTANEDPYDDRECGCSGHMESVVAAEIIEQHEFIEQVGRVPEKVEDFDAGFSGGGQPESTEDVGVPPSRSSLTDFLSRVISLRSAWEPVKASPRRHFPNINNTTIDARATDGALLFWFSLGNGRERIDPGMDLHVEHEAHESTESMEGTIDNVFEILEIRRNVAVFDWVGEAITVNSRGQ